jgi:hypothetical protein
MEGFRKQDEIQLVFFGMGLELSHKDAGPEELKREAQ